MSVLDDCQREEIAIGLFAATVERDAQQRLKASCYQALKKITCRVRRGALVLTGEVPSYFHKQLAQEAVRALALKYSISNQIAVASREYGARRSSPAKGGRYEH